MPRVRRVPSLVRAGLLLAVGTALPMSGGTLLPDFSESLVAGGISAPTAMSFAPDGRLFVCQQYGQLRVIKNGVLLPEWALSLTTDADGERGLLGVAFDPGFATNQHLYLYYTVRSTPRHNRVSRFTADGDVVLPDSEFVVLELDDLSEASNHNGGAIHFGPDGKLYVAVGDNANSANAQTLTNLLGKMLRINPDGSIPADNPFYQVATGKNRAIWAIGLRNPFTFAFQPGTGRMFINDVGQSTWEEINEGVPGGNYGWPNCEGVCNPPLPQFDQPVFHYLHTSGTSGGCCIAGGAFYNPSVAQFSPEYHGAYFFADYCNGWIRMLQPAQSNAVSGFATGLAGVVDLKVGPDGALYYLSRDAGAVYKIEANRSPEISAHPRIQAVAPGIPAFFSVTASGSQPLRYQWLRNEAQLPGATDSQLIVADTDLFDSGTAYSVCVTNAFGSVTSNPALLIVTTNKPPIGTITAPANRTLYRAGETLAFAGTAMDPREGPLPAGACSWKIVFHHDDHAHPFLGPINGVEGGSFVIPTVGETAVDVFYRIHLTVTNSEGLHHSTFVDVLPRTSTVTLATSPPGMRLTLDGQPVTAPFSFVGVEGIVRTLGVVSPQAANGTTYGFSHWSDNGAATHEISTPVPDATFTAEFITPGDPPLLQIAKEGQGAILSWPEISTGYLLQSSPTVAPMIPWAAVTNPVTVSNGLAEALVERTEETVFFRLVDSSPKQPLLSISRAGGGLVLSWPADAAGFVLQSATTPGPASLWTEVSQPILMTNSAFTLTLESLAGESYYRLFKPPVELAINVEPATDVLRLSWPAQDSNYILQSSPTLVPFVPWEMVTNPVLVTNHRQRVTLPVADGTRFFRLIKP